MVKILVKMMLPEKLKGSKVIPAAEAKLRFGEVTKHLKEKPNVPILLTWYNEPFAVIISAEDYLKLVD